MLPKVFGQVWTKTTAKAQLRNVESAGLLRFGDCGQFVRSVEPLRRISVPVPIRYHMHRLTVLMDVARKEAPIPGYRYLISRSRCARRVTTAAPDGELAARAADTDWPAVTRSMSTLKSLGKIRVGVIGDDNSVLDDHLAVLRLLSDYELIAVHKVQLESDQTTRPDGFGPTFASADEVTSHPDVDLVAVLGASVQARDHVRDAIAAGKDVFCDWPILSDPRIAYELAALAERSGISDIIGLFPRVSQATLYVGDLLAEGYIGNVCSVRLYANLAGAKASVPTGFSHSAQTISPIAELAGHFLDALFSIVGWPRRVSSAVGSRDAPGDATRTAARIRQLCVIGVLEGDGIFSAHFEEWSGPLAVQIDIAGDRGKLKIEAATDYNGENVAIEAFREGDDRPRLLAIPRSYKWTSSGQFPPGAVGLANLYASFVRDLHEGTERAPSMDDAVRMHELLQQITEAWDNGLGQPQP